MHAYMYVWICANVCVSHALNDLINCSFINRHIYYMMMLKKINSDRKVEQRSRDGPYDFL